MRKLMAVSLFLVLAAGSAFAHAGHIHTYMGTIRSVEGLRGFTIKTPDGDERMIDTAHFTTYTDENGHALKRDAALIPGSRVVVRMNIDGKTASNVKVGAVKADAPKK